MKKIICLSIICFFISCKSSEKINGFLEHDCTCRKYDAGSNVTFVHNSFDPILKVPGKWRELSMNSKFYNNSKKIVCISNEVDAVLQLFQFEIPICNPYKQKIINHYFIQESFVNNIKKRLNFWTDYEKYAVTLLESNEENYSVYLLSRAEEQKCVLIGMKNHIYYEFTLISSNLDEKSKAKILSDSFNLN